MKWEIDTNSGCWNWLLYVNPDGYGVDRHAGRQTGAHRVAYEKRHGSIPDGLTVDHLCFNPRCVNPDHLRLLTHSENARNQRSALKTHCKSGHAFSAENTYELPGSPGGRRCCRECNKIAAREYRARKAVGNVGMAD